MLKCHENNVTCNAKIYIFLIFFMQKFIFHAKIKGQKLDIIFSMKRINSSIVRISLVQGHLMYRYI